MCVLGYPVQNLKLVSLFELLKQVNVNIAFEGLLTKMPA